MSLERLVEFLEESKHTVILSGAGMSTESGIPDFRSADGWWKKYDPTQLASVDSLDRNYELFRDFYKYRLEVVAKCKPNVGHEVLADLEKQGLVQAIATQNIDEFHKEAGSKNIQELHGSIKRIFCADCGTPSTVAAFMDNEVCGSCGGRLRPGVVLFGEGLPQDVWARAQDEIEKSDLLIVIGTSLNVSPVNYLPRLSRGKKVLMNLDDTPFNREFDLIIKSKAGESLKQLLCFLKA